jgi:MoxR-like ATPase
MEVGDDNSMSDADGVGGGEVAAAGEVAGVEVGGAGEAGVAGAEAVGGAGIGEIAGAGEVGADAVGGAGAGEVAGVDDVVAGIAAQDYLLDEGLATAVFLALRLRRPLFLEGAAGAGKTELAKALAAWTGGRLVRLQCYEGIDAAQALYEWDHARQLLHLRTAEALGRTDAALEDELYDARFLVRRPLLQALEGEPGTPPPVLLIDEIDRADDEFEAFLLELLADWAVTIPELGTVRAAVPPVTVLTSNRTRDVHDALKRRCLYHWVDQPEVAREVAIVRLRAPEVPESLARQVAVAAHALRDLSLYKPPGVSETIDWAQALATLGRTALDERSADATLGTVVKYHEDQERVREHGLGTLVPHPDPRHA